MRIHSNDQIVPLISLIAEGNANLRSKLPVSILSGGVEGIHAEPIVTIDNADLDSFLQKFKMGSPLKNQHYLLPSIHLNRSMRTRVEFFGDVKQLIPVACIHDETRVVFLKLATNPKHVDGYDVGTLTYPQGHARYSDEVDNLAHPTEIGGRKLWSPISVDKILRDELFREINEELTMENEYFRVRLMRDISDNLFRGNGAAPVYPIYINKPGTTGRHVAMLYDIDLTHSETFRDHADWIVSNEPDKHTVELCTVMDLVDIEDISKFCVWVAASFSILPFISSSFMNDLLKELTN